MLLFIVKRLLAGVLLILAITASAFALIYAGGADIARNILGELATQEQVDQLSAQLGLDRPLIVQYGSWLLGAVQGDLGTSYFTFEPVSQALATRLPVTLSLVITTVLISACIAAVLGVAAAVRGGWQDRVVQVVSVAGEAIPNFWLALVLVSAFAITWPVFPATGFIPLTDSVGGWISTITLPVIALVVGTVAASTQQVRSAVIDTLSKDYVRTLRARGLPESRVVFRHALRNSAPPAITILSLQFIGLFGGAVLIERVFALPGVGSLAVNAAVQGDLPMIMGVLVVTTIIAVLVNLLVDIALTWVNPKVRLQ